MNAAAVLNWLERFGRHVTIQQLPPSRQRAKNRIVLQFGPPGSDELQVVGGRDLRDCAWKAYCRLADSEKATLSSSTAAQPEPSKQSSASVPGAVESDPLPAARPCEAKFF